MTSLLLLPILLAPLIVVVSYARLMGVVAGADPGDKTRLLTEGLDGVTPAVRSAQGWPPPSLSWAAWRGASLPRMSRAAVRRSRPEEGLTPMKPR